jgi:hypothetical protein
MIAVEVGVHDGSECAASGPGLPPGWPLFVSLRLSEGEKTRSAGGSRERMFSSNVRRSRYRVICYFERGDEFLIILPGTSVEDAYQGVAKRLRKLVKDNRFILNLKASASRA